MKKALLCAGAILVGLVFGKGVSYAQVEERLPGDGMGYRILNKIPDKTDYESVREQVTLANTIYEIRNDFDLGDEAVAIPANCVLRFSGGSLRNGSVSGRPAIEAPSRQVFENIALDVDYVKAEWIGVLPYGNAQTNAANLQDFITRHLRTDPVLDHKRYTVFFGERARYNIGAPVTIPKGHAVFFKGSAPSQDYQSYLTFTFGSETCITAYGQFTAECLGFQGNAVAPNEYIINYKRTDSPSQETDVATNTDGRLLECSFTYAQTCVRLTGRQTYIDGCWFSLSARGILIEDLIPAGNPSYAFGRNNCIQNCRFHANFHDGCIECTGTAQRNITIADNIADITCGTLVKGNFSYGRITGNSVHYTHNDAHGSLWSVMEFNEVSNTLIQNNKCDYEGDYIATGGYRYPNNFRHFIVFNGAVSKTDIVDNKFGSCSQEGFVFKNDVSDVTICRNTAYGVCTDNALYVRTYSADSKKARAYLVKFNQEATLDRISIRDNVTSEDLSPSNILSASIKTDRIDLLGSRIYSGAIYRIGKVTEDEAGGGFVMISGAINNHDQSFSVVTVSRMSGGSIRVQHTELLGDSEGEVYFDPNTNELFYKPLYEYRNGLSMHDVGYGFILCRPTFYADSLPSSAVLCTIKNAGDSKTRPDTLDNTRIGFSFFDTTLGMPVYWNGSRWVDAMGRIVE